MKTLHEKVAAKLEADPSLLHTPLENIDRWLAKGHTAPHRLEQWRDIITAARLSPPGFQRLLELLRARDEAADRLLDFAPFAGVLDRVQRRNSEPRCACNF